VLNLCAIRFGYDSFCICKENELKLLDQTLQVFVAFYGTGNCVKCNQETVAEKPKPTNVLENYDLIMHLIVFKFSLNTIS
jgi:hypothetical protein